MQGKKIPKGVLMKMIEEAIEGKSCERSDWKWDHDINFKTLLILSHLHK